MAPRFGAFLPFLRVELCLTAPLFLDFAPNLQRNGELANKALDLHFRKLLLSQKTQESKPQLRKGAMVYLLIPGEKTRTKFTFFVIYSTSMESYEEDKTF